MTDWRDLSDDELRARLLARRWPVVTVDELVRHRDDDTSVAPDVIDDELGDGDPS